LPGWLVSTRMNRNAGKTGVSVWCVFIYNVGFDEFNKIGNK